jgi:hypothetical protein
MKSLNQTELAAFSILSFWAFFLGFSFSLFYGINLHVVGGIIILVGLTD